jgi:hypothetical protein
MPEYADETPTPVLCLSCEWEGKMGEEFLEGWKVGNSPSSPAPGGNFPFQRSLATLPRLKSEIHVTADVSEGEGVPE